MAIARAMTQAHVAGEKGARLVDGIEWRDALRAAGEVLAASGLPPRAINDVKNILCDSHSNGYISMPRRKTEKCLGAAYLVSLDAGRQFNWAAAQPFVNINGTTVDIEEHVEMAVKTHAVGMALSTRQPIHVMEALGLAKAEIVQPSAGRALRNSGALPPVQTTPEVTLTELGAKLSKAELAMALQVGRLRAIGTLSFQTEDKANEILGRVYKRLAQSHKPPELCAAACLYVAIVINNENQWSALSIARVSGQKYNEVRSTHNLVKKLLKEKIAQRKPAELLKELAVPIGVGERSIFYATQRLATAEHSPDLFAVRNPYGVAAAALWISADELGYRNGFARVAALAGVSTKTLKNNVDLLIRVTGQFVDRANRAARHIHYRQERRQAQADLIRK